MSPIGVAAVVLVAAITTIAVMGHVQRVRLLHSLRSNSGRPRKGPRLQPALTRRLHDLLGDSADRPVWILDDRTWNDLDLDALLERIDHTLTAIGCQSLYRLLRTPLLEAEDIDRRRAQVERLRTDSELRERLQLALLGADDRVLAHLADALWDEPPLQSGWERALPILGIAPLIAVAAAFFGSVGWGPAVLAMLVNLLVHYGHLRRVDELPLQPLGRLLGAAHGVSVAIGELIPELRAAIEPGLARTTRTRRRLAVLQFEDGLGLAAYVRVILLLDVAAWSAAAAAIRDAAPELRRLLVAVGEADALIALASWVDSAGPLSVPEFVASLEHARFEDLRHPLLPAPVPYSLTLDGKGLLVTGSNMSGKTTFLKAVGVNAVLAQAVGVVTAARWAMPLLRPVASIGRADNLIEGHSYYLAEVESVARMVRSASTSVTHLFLADELFRGTNAVERIAGAAAVLGHLAANGDLVLAATHDLELSDLLGDRYRPIHFGEQVDANGLQFDYLLQPGIASGRTAVALLEITGYPDAVVSEARRLVVELES